MSEFLTKFSYWVSAIISGLSVLNINTVALLVGMALGFATFVITWVYKHKEYKLQVQLLKPIKNEQYDVP